MNTHDVTSLQSNLHDNVTSNINQVAQNSLQMPINDISLSDINQHANASLYTKINDSVHPDSNIKAENSLQSTSNDISFADMLQHIENSLPSNADDIHIGSNGIVIEYDDISQEMMPGVMTIQPESNDTEIIDVSKDIIRLQKQDDYFGPIYNFISKQILPKQAKRAKHIILISQQYEIRDGKLYHFYTRRIRKQKHGNAPTQFISLYAMNFGSKNYRNMGKYLCNSP